MEEQREDIIKENNTAQDKLLSILESLTKNSKKLEIEEALFGDLDFSVLKTLGYGNIKTIILKDGQITNIDGLNTIAGLLHFECTNNMLIALDDLPASLKHLIIGSNYISTLDLRHLDQLQTLHVSHNKLTVLEKIPKTLVELVCDNNKLQQLDLEGLEELKVLNINNNPITLLENLPTTVVEFKMDNCPSIEFRNSDLPALRAENKDAEKELKNHATYLEALHEYFKLKQEYETKLSKMKKTAFKKEPSRKLGRLAALSVKPQCINCKRPVGTLFSNREGDKYTAICGDKGNPCNLNIKIYNGKIINLRYLLTIYREEIVDLKDTIIRQKLDTLFSYVSEEKAVTLFKKELDAYNENSKMYRTLLDKYTDLYDNKHMKETAAKTSGEIFVMIEKLRDLLQEYEATENTTILEAAMNLQVNELYPEIRTMRLLKNEVLELNEPNEDHFKVFTYPVALAKLDHNAGEKATVIKFHKD
jgi:hypothetical protein